MTLVSLLGAACSGGDADPSGQGGAAPEDIAFSVRIVDATASPVTPLEGVEVCVADRPDVACATSDADGRLMMSLPAESELMLRCESESYGPAYMTWTVGTEDIDAGSFSLLTKTKMGLLIALSGAEAWPEKGAITANVYEDLDARTTRVAGATFAITPNAGGGPAYVSAQKVPDPSLTASTEGGPAVFFDVEEGEVTITLEHPSRECSGGFGWKAGDERSLRSKIFPGGLSNVTFVCSP
ncbi:hypothetical protein [Sorangium cellulosum]|uniref:Carboxypeptidase regulatory-like domain-containing protein n=1 Tax=Sorangium cellulosum TaxID=56 RepID=A0A150QIN3_SORCE|nr:hypothetical protein [Sorangium cellulosum]KYF67576.1 hypothetical protein BE15_26610 [Sorangium cellulosum]